MLPGIAALVLGYLFSQFYRAFLAVLSPVLGTEVGAGADDLATASGLWFLAFAAMQIPVGWSLDTFGPRRTAAVLLGVAGGGGAAVFALATTPLHLNIAMALIGIGCAPVLMSSYYIFARNYSPAVFATLAASVIGVGSLGNIAGAWPLAMAVQVLGWRETVWLLAAGTVLTALAIAALVRDPPMVRASDGARGGLIDVLRIRALWPILPLLFVNYAAPAGVRGLWAGPFFAGVYGADTVAIGQATLLMAVAMVAGSFLYGPLDRILGTRKWVALGGSAIGVVCLVALALAPGAGFWTTALLLAAMGAACATFPVLMAHGRSFLPPHLLGRGVTLLNLFSIGGVGLLQTVSARVHGAAPAGMEWTALFGFFGLMLAMGCLVYLFSRDSTN
jgi:MFS family permease